MSLPFEDQDETAGRPADVAEPVSETPSETPDFPTLAGRAQAFLNEGRFDAAREVFVEILGVIEDAASYQRAVALERVGFCSLMEGQPLVAAGFLQQATEMIEAIDPTEAAKALQGVIQSELGQVFSLTGHVDQAREAYEAAVEIARSVDDTRALGIDLDHLGVLNLKQGHVDDARVQFAEALEIFQALQQPGAQAIALHHLGLAAEQAQKWDDAEQHYTDAARLLVDNGDYVSAARLFSLAAAVCMKVDRNDAAEAWFRNALEHSRLGHAPADLRRTLSSFARLLQSKPGGFAEARELVEEALAAGENSFELDVWALYGQLADIVEMQAASIDNAAEAQSLRAAAHNYRHICQYGPRLLATLREIGEEPSFGAAVILERVGRCCLIGGRPAPAVILFRQTLAALDAVPDTEAAKGLRGILQSATGDAYRLAGFPAEARKAYQAALEAADLRICAASWCRSRISERLRWPAGSLTRRSRISGWGLRSRASSEKRSFSMVCSNTPRLKPSEREDGDQKGEDAYRPHAERPMTAATFASREFRVATCIGRWMRQRDFSSARSQDAKALPETQGVRCRRGERLDDIRKAP